MTPGLCKVSGNLESKFLYAVRGGQGKEEEKHQEYAVNQITLQVWLKQ